VDGVQRMLQQLEPLRRPPIDQWHPALSGDIDITIATDGQWYHEGVLIARQSLVRLFASILRYEPGLGYVLVTPVEKWRITVADAPFVATALALREEAGRPVLYFVTNVGEEVRLDAQHPLYLAESASAQSLSAIVHVDEAAPDDARPYIVLREGISALLSRPVYYQLAEYVCEHNGQLGVWSANYFSPF
jgi:hypothetical protein